MKSISSATLKLALIGLTSASFATGFTASAQAFTIGGPVTAQDFEDLNLDIAYSAESRWGSGSVGGNTFELDIHRINDSGGFVNDAQGEFNWINGQAVDFSLSFDGISSLVYTVGGTVLSTTTVESSFSDFYLRTAARKDGSSLLLSDLSLTDRNNSGALGDVSSSCSGGIGCGFFDASYLHIADLSGPFTLTGKSTMAWDPAHKPTQSNLAYQIKLIAGASEPPASTPEPASMLGLVLVGAADVKSLIKS